jgi:zinc protease
VGVLFLAGACAAPPAPPAAPAPEAPAAPTAPAAPAAPAKVAPPTALPARPMEFPPFAEATLPNGLKVIVVEKHDLPLVNANLFIQTGAAADPAGKAGLASLMADVLTKGTPTRTAKQISTTIEGVGGSISSAATDDYVVVSDDVLKEQLPLAIELLADVSLHPSFPSSELEIARTRSLSGLQVALAEASEVAQRRFAKEVYGAGHPYSQAPVPATVKAIQRADLTRFHDRYFRPENALLVVSGDVTNAEVQELARKYFGSWKRAAVPAVTLTPPAPRQASTIYLVNRPGSVQSNILVGNLTIRPGDPDYYPLQVLNKIVGGGTDSWLFTILREQKGWTYGAYSSAVRPKGLGYFVANAEVRTAVTDSSLVEMLHQLNRARDEQVSQADLDAAKSFLVGSFPLRIQTAGQIASQIAQNRLLGLSENDLTSYRERIQAVTAADVQRVAQKYVRPGQAVIVVVGDAPQIYSKLQGIAPIVLTDLDGKPMDPGDLVVKASTEKHDASKLKPMTLKYSVIYQGNPLGTATTTLAKEGAVWVATQSVSAGGGSQESEARFDDAFTPISGKQTIAQGPVQMEIITTYKDGKVTGTAKLPIQMGGDKTIDAEAPAGTLFSGEDSWVLAAADLAPGKSITLPIFNGQSGSVMNATFKVGALEEVTVPAGKFQAYKVDGAVGPQQMTLWLRQDAPHIAVKQEISGQPISIELQAVE